jgi:hypothetical protein
VINREIIPIDQDKIITVLELDSFILKEVGHAFGERNKQLIIAEKATLGFCLVLSVIYSFWFLIPSFILILVIIPKQIELVEERIEIAKYFKRKQQVNN